MNSFFSGGEKNIYRLVNTILLSGAVMFLMGKVVGIYEPQNLQIAAGAVFAVATAVFFSFFDKKKMISLIVLILLAGWTIVIIGRETSVLFLKSYVKWFAGVPGWEADWWNGYQMLQICLVVVVIYILQRLLDKYFWIRVLPAIAMAIGLVYIMIFKVDIPYQGVVCSVCYMLLMLMEWTQKNWKKKRSKNMEQYMLWFVPFAVIYFVILLTMPISDKPYEWKYVKAAYHYMEEKIRYYVKEITQGEDEYSTALSGFSGENRLSGTVEKNQELVMTLRSEKPMRTNVYLVGKVYNHFETDGWKAYQKESATDRYIDTVETASAAALFGEEVLNNYVLETSLEVCYENIATDYLFAPMKTYRVEERNRAVTTESETGSIHFDKRKRYGSKFATKYYQVNIGNPAFLKLLETEIVYDADKTDQRLAKLKLLSNIKITETELDNYQKSCYDNYSEAPILSFEVKEYLKEITKDARTRLERLQAMERELSSYQYSLSVKQMPDTVVDAGTFLDYFLLESRQGYCTHFATAFILLARSEGYPARYVQGYCVPMAGEKNMDVTSDMAHGWPEVYIDDIGWIPFEPTPGNGELRYVSWGQGNPSGKTYHTNEQDYYNRYGRLQEEEMLTEAEKEAERKAQAKRVGNIAKKAFVSILLGCVFILLVLMITTRIMYRRLSEKQRYFYKIRRNLWLLKKLGMKMNETETLAEYAERISDFLPQTVSIGFLSAYEEVIYADREINEELMRQTESEEKKLWRVLMAKYSPRVKRL